jgi:hypothetical protein
MKSKIAFVAAFAFASIASAYTASGELQVSTLTIIDLQSGEPTSQKVDFWGSDSGRPVGSWTTFSDYWDEYLFTHSRVSMVDGNLIASSYPNPLTISRSAMSSVPKLGENVNSTSIHFSQDRNYIDAFSGAAIIPAYSILQVTGYTKIDINGYSGCFDYGCNRGAVEVQFNEHLHKIETPTPNSQNIAIPYQVSEYYPFSLLYRNESNSPIYSSLHFKVHANYYGAYVPSVPEISTRSLLLISLFLLATLFHVRKPKHLHK